MRYSLNKLLKVSMGVTAVERELRRDVVITQCNRTPSSNGNSPLKLVRLET
jgi:hypothetical protein